MGGDSPPLLLSCDTPPGILCTFLVSLAQERHETVGASPEEDHEADKGTERTSPLRELQLLILEKKRLHGDLLATFQCVKGPTEKLKDFSSETVATGKE